MTYKPDEKMLLQCVLKIEGLTTELNGIRIRHTHIQDDIPVKTNNTSKVVKMKLEYEVNGYVKMAAVVVKIPFLRSTMVFEFFKGLQFFVKEAQFYESIAPRLHKLLRSDIAPTLFVTDEHHVLFLEDMCVRGYRIQIDGQLDADHSIVALRHLARMHAASHVIYLEDPNCMSDLIKKQFLISDTFVEKLYIEVKPLLGTLARVQCLSAETVERFDSAVRKARSDINAMLQSGRFQFSVLNHGDLKAHNILFKYDEHNRPVQCSFIDFQICYWTSPVLDVIFLAIQSMQCEVVTSDFDNLLDSYLSTLNSTFEKLNCDVKFTKNHFQRDWNDVKAFKVFTFLFRMMIDIREFCKEFEYAKFEEASPEMLEDLSQSAEIRNRAQFWLGEFEKNGVI